MSLDLKRLARKPAVIAVALFVIGFMSLRACEAGTVEMGASPTNVHGAGLVYTESLSPKWDVGIHLTDNLQWYNETLRPHAGVFAQRIVRRGNFQMGLGVARHTNTSRLIGSPFGFALSIGYDFTDHWGVRYRHWSNAGSAKPNRGLDLLLISYRF